MSHPIMFDDADPLLGRIRDLALALPGADEKVSHGRPAFFTKKIFAYYGGSERIDGDWVQHPWAVIVMVDPEERPAVEQDDRVFVPAYLGPYGWLGIDLVPDGSPGHDTVDWNEVAELLDASFRLTAPTRCVRELDEKG